MQMNRMKKAFSILIVLIISLSVTKGQTKNDAKNNTLQLDKLKITYITNEIHLSSEESHTFWPLYNKYREEISQVHKLIPDDEILLEEKILNIRKRYQHEFKNLLKSSKRAKQLFIAEKKFTSYVRKELEKRGRLKK